MEKDFQDFRVYSTMDERMNEALQDMVWWLWGRWHFKNNLSDVSQRCGTINILLLKKETWVSLHCDFCAAAIVEQWFVFQGFLPCVSSLPWCLAVAGWRVTSGMQTASSFPGSLLTSLFSPMEFLQWNLKDADRTPQLLPQLVKPGQIG